MLQMSQKVAKIERVNIEDLALDFTIPGYDIELRVSAVVSIPEILLNCSPAQRKRHLGNF